MSTEKVKRSLWKSTTKRTNNRKGSLLADVRAVVAKLATEFETVDITAPSQNDGLGQLTP